MFDDSSLSLSVSDPNPSLEQYDDGGSSVDYAGIVNSVGQWGTEIAGAITGNAPAPIITNSGMIGYSGGPLQRPMNPTTKLLVIALVIAGGYIAIRKMG